MARKKDTLPAPVATPAEVPTPPDPARQAFLEGAALEARGLLTEAEAAYRRAISLGPDAASACNNLGHILLKQGRTAEAEIFLRQALRIRPQHVNALINLGGMLLQRHATAAEARSLLETAVRLDPANYHAWNNLGSALGALRLLAPAEQAYRRAMALEPANAAAPSNLGALFASAGRWPDAEHWFRAALRLDPGSVQAQVNLCFALLAQGRFDEAWPWHDARYALGNTQSQTRLPDLPMPAWRGEPLAGKSLLVWPEQGFGDYIQFVRYAPMLKARGLTRLTLMCPEVLHALLGTVDGVDEVVSGTVQLARHDYWTFVLSLPQHLGTTLATIPARLPYLRAPPDRAARWAGRLPAGFKVGLAWKGSPGHRNDASRSLPGVDTLAPLWREPGVQFISLQKDKGAAADATEPLQVPPGQPLLDLGPQIQDFADLAAVIDQLDLVISVDTAVAHLAGALGKPVWVLLPAWGTDWRWLRERTDSPWYPGVLRLFRQTVPDDWAAVVEELADALARIASGSPDQTQTAAPSQVAVAAALGRPVRLQLAIRSGRVVPPQEVAAAQAADACYARAAELSAQQRWNEAEAQLRQAVALAPGHASAHNNLGNLLRGQQRMTEAEAAYRQALDADPRHIAALTNLASLLGMQRRSQEAEPLLRQALALAPDVIDVHNNLGIVLDDLKRGPEAEASFRRALELEPRHAGAMNNLGSLLMHEGRLDEAEQLIRQALALTPNMTEAWINLGFLLRGMGRAAESEAAYRTALEREPGNTLAQLNLALLLLSLGRMREAWPLHQARRAPQRRQTNTRAPDVTWPQWQGEPLAGRSLLVWPEQGLGDGIQFARYARLLKQRGAAHVSFACQAALAPLLRTIEGIDEVVVKVSELRPHDYWVFLMDLPERFDTTLETIPAALPYVHALPERVAQWRPRLPPAPRVGLVWRGSTGHRNDAHRSLPGLATLAPLWQVAGVQFVSLQKGAGEDEAAQPPAGQPLVALGAQLQDFADAAAVVSQLDLVICVDTAVAHLAGALGKPVWVLLPALGTDWRWLHDREDSPWYPGVMRLFRQVRVDDWTDVLQSVVQALRAFLAAPGRPPAVLPAPIPPVAAAEQALRAALATDPAHGSTMLKLGALLASQQRFAEAEGMLRRAVELLPHKSRAHTQLGQLLARLGRTAEAQSCYRRALQLAPDHAGTHNNLGGLLLTVGQVAEAEALLRRATALDPGLVDAWINLGLLLRAQDRLAEAETVLQQALALAPQGVRPRLALCFLYLSLGRLAEGWPLYEARFGPEGSQTRGGVQAARRWQGGPLAGRAVLLWPEQGQGDFVHYVRYAAELKRRGASRVAAVCAPQLADLLRTAEGMDEVGTDLDRPPAHDLWAYVCDLPRWLTPSCDAIPARLPYLRADPQRAEAWRGRLPEGRRAGLVWRGWSAYSNDAQRSLPRLDLLAPLWDVPGWRFISLQKGAGEDEASHPPQPLELLALGGELGDFAATAAVIEQLDLVITVDTAVAHVAGALGKPVWVLLPALATDWRWFTGRSDSPWYPGVMRLFRQQRVGDWGGVVAQVAEALRGFHPMSGPPASAPGAAEACYRRGIQLADQRQWQAAAAAYREAIALDADHAGAHHNLGVVLAECGDVAQAVASYRRALLLAPDHAITLTNLGALLSDQGQAAEAEPMLRRAVALRPDYAKARYQLGRLQARAGRRAEAEADLRQAIALDPGLAPAHSDLGALLNTLGRWTEAEASTRRAIALQPQACGPWINLALLMGYQHRHAEAEAAWREALRLQPGQPEAQLGLAFLLLSLGRFAEAWPLHRARHGPGFQRFGTGLPALAYPRWQGEPLAGKALVVWPEQGLGDALQFIRYAALLKAQGLARLTVVCKPPLAALLATAEGVDTICTDAAQLGPHDHWTFLLDLPERLGTTLENLPARLPYLQAPADRRSAWQGKLPAGRRVGLVWRGGPQHDNDANRSLPGLASLAPLWAAAAAGTQFISLQKGAGEDEALAPPAGQPLLALGGQLRDFADTAAVVEQLDLVITVDTSVAHLAGALGKPVWVLLPAWGTDWRWLVDRDDSPWYPGVMRLFRQRQPGPAGWAETVHRVAAALGPWLDPPAAAGPSDRAIASADALFHQAVHLAQAGDHAQAEAAYLQGLALAPRHVGALNNFGLLLAHRGALAQAEAVYRQGLAVEPDHASLLLNLGTLLGDTRRPQEAEALLRRAAQNKPADPKPLNNLGRLLARTGRAAEAEAAYREAMSLDATGTSSARANLASLLAQQGRLQEAEASARQAIALNPVVADHWLVLGQVLRHARREADAEAALRQALALQPGHATAQLSLCHLLLSWGRFEEGWALHGARRLRRPGSALAVAPDLPFPEWQGEPLQGRSILVWQEQGLGDALQFIRYAPLLKARGAARVTLHCHPLLAPLLARTEGVDQVVTRPADCQAHDHWVMLLDLPGRCGTTLASVPGQLPYLHSGPEAIARWRPRLPAARFKVGLVWRGSPEQENDAHRSLPGLATLAPLWQVPGVTFISLQKGVGEDEALRAPQAQPLTALGHAFEDFDDTAAVVSQLDLVITVCTSVAHLAGGLGRPTWVLLPALTTDWRWLLDRADSPWYPEVMRLFRQRTHGDWAPLIDEVRAALAALAARRG